MFFEGSGKDQAGKDLKFDLKLTYDVVETNPTFAPSDFVFTPPPGAKLAASKPASKSPTPAPKLSEPKKKSP
jgi:hypothetical protein